MLLVTNTGMVFCSAPGVQQVFMMDHAQGKIQFADLGDRQHPLITKEYEIPGNPGLPARYRDQLLIPAGHLGLSSVKPGPALGRQRRTHTPGSIWFAKRAWGN